MARFLKCAGTFLCAGIITDPAQAGDFAKGQHVFQAQCSSCHVARPGDQSSVGPNLFGVVGRRAGTLPGYSYSSAMRSAGFAWSTDQLRTYLPAPRKLVPGTKMTFPGLHDPAQLQDLVAYLASLK